MIKHALIIGLSLIQTGIAVAQTVATVPATNIGVTQGVLNGRVTGGGSGARTSFQWGTTTAYGFTNTGNPDTVAPGISANFNTGLYGLSPNTTYHYRAVITTPGGTVNGQDLSFTTPTSSAPSINTVGKVYGRGDLFGSFYLGFNPNNAATTVSFEYGTSTAYGQVSTDISPSNVPAGLNGVQVLAKLTNLQPFVVYHYRWVCTNSSGVTRSDDMQFNTFGVGVNTIPASAFHIYPSPATDYLNIELPGSAHDYAVRIVDVTGKQLEVTSVATDKKIWLDVSKLACGTYSLTIINSGGQYSQLFQKQ